MDYILARASLLLSWASLFFAIAAAIFWARAAYIRIPHLSDKALSGLNGVTAIVREQSGLNANAAECAAASVVAQILARVIAA